ncbi:hypothetical protein P8H27_01935 [Pseudomonas sp. sp1636]|uniref:hypothetical protein n=1 Tax=Pseudomonas sp. sp1636 TaxID=3036707 RepID=UPI0025A63069|nr:hypothetical protein [Pseudomonas sp. sp1636]MDM8347660.1 hypothetical protein [Pseudomonas sp. sp1636]
MNDPGILFLLDKSCEILALKVEKRKKKAIPLSHILVQSLHAVILLATEPRRH